MYFGVLKAEHIENYKLALSFEDGKTGIVDLSGYIEKGGVFSRFSDFDYFMRFYVDDEADTVCWPDGVDIAPETLYHEATGEPLPEWVEE
ncbi:DUF2442 domain-containing protein [bacterium]|nr:DUF2442 domain-containing protein [bacterium]